MKRKVKSIEKDLKLLPRSYERINGCMSNAIKNNLTELASEYIGSLSHPLDEMGWNGLPIIDRSRIDAMLNDMLEERYKIITSCLS